MNTFYTPTAVDTNDSNDYYGYYGTMNERRTNVIFLATFEITYKIGKWFLAFLTWIIFNIINEK